MSNFFQEKISTVNESGSEITQKPLRTPFHCRVQKWEYEKNDKFNPVHFWELIKLI